MEREEENKSDHRKRQEQVPAPPVWEKAIGILGLLLTLGVLGYLTYQSVTGDSSPADISVEVKEIRNSGQDYLVLFEARNRGAETAAAVVVEGHLRRNGEVIEKSMATLDYVPAKSRREGGLFFNTDPGGAQLSLKALGYVQP